MQRNLPAYSFIRLMAGCCRVKLYTPEFLKAGNVFDGSLVFIVYIIYKYGFEKVMRQVKNKGIVRLFLEIRRKEIIYCIFFY